MTSIVKIIHGYCRALRKRYRQALMHILLYKCGKDLKIFGQTHIDMPSLVTLGDNVSLNQNTSILARYEPVVIGNNVVISSGAIITSAGYNYKGKGPHTNHDSKPVTINNNAWIGANAVILPGITIGEYAVIGAGAVVTKDVSPYTMVAGIPAQPIKSIPEKS